MKKNIGRLGTVSFGSLTLPKRVGLLVLAGLVTGLTIFSWTGVQSVQDSVDRTLDERLVIARVMADHIEQTLSFILMQMQVQEAHFKGGLPEKDQFVPVADSLRSTLEKLGFATQSIVLTDKSGKVIQTYPESSEITAVNMTGYPEIKKSLITGQPAISALVLSPLKDVPAIFITAPILDEKSEIIGGLTSIIDIEASSNDALKPSISLGKTGYTEIVDGNGVVLGRSYPGTPPKVFENSDHTVRFAVLINQKKAVVGTCHRCHDTGQSVERQRDVLAFVPLSLTSWGVAIRQSEEEALAPTRQLEERFILLGLIGLAGTSLITWFVMRAIVNPIRMLTFAAKKVTAGDFKAPIPFERDDEIGELSAAFNTMTRELANSREQLLARNDELSALNSIAATVSQSLKLEDVLKSALQKVLDVTGSSAGCVFLSGLEGDKLKPVNHIGPPVFECQQLGQANASCACYQALHRGQTLMVNHISQCPRLADEAVTKEDIECFVSVPLMSKDRTLGIMNVACTSERSFAERDFELLDSMGRHVGLAVENSILFEEVKKKEESKGQLLSSVIAAQEEERKRISRELHDEYGQVLAGLIMSIESLQNMLPPDQIQLKLKLDSNKGLLIGALDNLRRLTLDLRPSVLDDLGLVAAIRTYADDQLRTAGIRLKFESKGLRQRLSPALETALFRIVQEAIHNIIKHAEAHNVIINLQAVDGEIVTTVKDDGIGFDMDEVKARIGKKSLGILGIQERTDLLGGTFIVQSQPNQGTLLTVKMPVSNEDRLSPTTSLLRGTENG